MALGIGTPARDGNHVSIEVKPSAVQCADAATVMSAKLEWRPRGGQSATVPLTLSGTTYAGDIPTQPDGTVVQYKLTLALSDGSEVSYPKNEADPFYEMYVGNVQTIWCADFEQGAADWTHGATIANRDEWQDGEPMGLGGDPKAAHGGTKVFGLDLRNDGTYRSRATMFAESPEIDLAGETQVRLQYHRWLGVEDGFFDQAKIYANGTEVWRNFGSATEQSAGVSHIDREWRFQDVDLSAQAAAGKVKLKFEITSDEGLELGGWTMDDVCIVAMRAPDTCTDDCEPPSDDGGCCSVGGGPEGALGLSLLTLGLVLRRRRTRTA
jgi:MYXO-CTERM domain-containing protein